MSISERVIKVVADRQSRKEEDISLDEQVGVDSLEKLDLLVAIEKEFNISVSDKEMQELTCYKDLEDLLSKKGVN